MAAQSAGCSTGDRALEYREGDACECRQPPYEAEILTGIRYVSVIVEFSIEGGAFQLGEVLSGPPDMRLELERIVPTGNQVMPFIWATGQNQAAFEEMVRTHPSVKELQVLDRIEDSALYRIEWEEAPTDLLEGIARTDAVILEARGDGRWSFRLRFPDHQRLSTFHDYLIDRGLHVDVERTYTLTESGEHGHQFDLTEAQRKALVLATERGYFDVPRGTTLDELADELGITRQALSERIRRGSRKLFDSTLRSSASGPE